MSDEDFGSVNENHSKLIESVQQLDKIQRIKEPQRIEPSFSVTQFDLVKTGTDDNDTLNIGGLAKTFGKMKTLGNSSKIFRSSEKKTKVLLQSLDKRSADKIKRIVGYKNTSKDLRKWHGIVARNRTVDHLSFPLHQPSMRIETTTEYLKNRFRMKSDLEKAFDALEPEPEESKVKPKKTLPDLSELREEKAKLRAQKSYEAQKAHRLRKIKSKKFHRIERKALMKKQLKEFEELQKTNPEAALEKLEELERARAEERMTLRHKTTGQWARNKQIRAKYDKESRQELAKQLAISRDLTQKLQKVDDSDDDDAEQENSVKLQTSDKGNPWTTAVNPEAEINEFVSNYKKYWGDKNKSEEAATNEKVEENTKLKKNKDKKNSKIKIYNYSKSLNPVVSVTIEQQNKPQDKETNNTLTKKSKKQLVSAKTKPESSKKKVKATQSWMVTSVESTENKEPKDLNIDEMFEDVEDKIQEKINVKLKKIKSNKSAKIGELGELEDNDSDGDEVFDDIKKLGLKKQKLKSIIDKPMEETVGERRVHGNSEIEKLKKLAESLNENREKKVEKKTEIDPNKFINMKPKELKTALAPEITEDALDDSETEDQEQIISEAFADDDVVDEFRKEKNEEIKNSRPEDIDLSLPGWGSWSEGGKKSSRKNRRFILKFPKDAPRRDENKGQVIIFEENKPKIKEHQVSELPHPFTSVEEFEASIQAPIGRNFVPETVFKKLIKPAVKTKLGEVIEPMSDEILVNTKNLKRKKKLAGPAIKLEKKKKKAE